MGGELREPPKHRAGRSTGDYRSEPGGLAPVDDFLEFKRHHPSTTPGFGSFAARSAQRLEKDTTPLDEQAELPLLDPSDDDTDPPPAAA